MKSLDEIKQMMAAGDAAQADVALKELLAKEPDNLQAKMLYGTCRQLLGDEKTFKRIHDELAPVMEMMSSETTESGMWAKYNMIHSDASKDALTKRSLINEDGAVSADCVIIVVLIVVALATGAWIFGKSILDQFNVSGRVVCAYAGPEYYEMQKSKSASPEYQSSGHGQEKFKEISGEGSAATQ